jgi:hypothetical protein
MPRSARNAAIRVAVVDGVLVLALPLLLLALDSGAVPFRSWWIAAAGSAFLGAVVSWRGYCHARSVLAGAARWYRLPLEGFAIGFVPPFLWLSALAAGTALSAGAPYDSAESWGLAEWGAYLAFASEISLVTGCTGAVVGLILTGLNRLLLPSAA